MCMCDAPLKDVAFCSRCGALKKSELTSPFKVFELEECFFDDLPLLQEKYLTLQNKLHPDRFTDAQEKKLSEDYSGYINWAYQLLKHPLNQAEFLLKDFSGSLPQADLMEQMEKHDFLESLVSKEERALFQKNIEEEKNQTEHKMLHFLKQKNKEKAGCYFMKLKFLSRLLEEIFSHQERL